jgi:hydroxymethylpyrimidine pyrophosphatase-like HAD family hydrolase
VEDREVYGVDLVAELKRLFSPGLTITRTHPRLVEGTAQGVDKGLGVLHLCELLNINPQRVLAIGDSDNDIPMLEAVGFGVAMGNSSPGVMAVAQYNAPPVEADGAAVALQELVLKHL